MAQRIYQLVLACSLILHAHSIAITSSINQQALNQQTSSSADRFILMPFSTLNSILPLSSYVPHTFDSSVVNNNIPSINTNGLYSIPVLSVIVSDISDINDIPSVTDISSVNDEFLATHTGYIAPASAMPYISSESASYFVNTPIDNVNNSTNEIHAAQLGIAPKIPPINNNIPVVNKPVVNNPVVNNNNIPVVNKPVVNKPVINSPVVNKPVVNNPVVSKPVVNNPVVSKPVVNNPVVNKPVVNNPLVNKPVVNIPLVNKPVVNNPLVNKPVVNSPVVNKPVVNNSVINKPVVNNNNTPVVNKNIVANTIVTPVTPTVQHIKIPVPTAGYTSTLITGGSLPNVLVTVKELPNEEALLRPCYRGDREVPFSQYWIPKENEWDETNNGKRVYLGGNQKTRLFDKNHVELGMVPIDMFEKCRMEGTCLLENGDLINIDNTTNSFMRVGRRGREHNVFGLGSGSQNLVPFVSVAANDLPYGQKLYIPQLDGLDLGGNQRHNGCVRVDDDSWSFDSCQIDFFVLSYVDYLWLDLDDKVTIKQKDCEIKNYITKHHLSLVQATANERIIPSLLEAKYVPQ